MSRGFLVVAVVAALGVACGGRIAQSAECSSYLRCIERSSGIDGVLRDAYGEAGTCWQSDNMAAQRCTDTCKSVLDQLKAANPDAGC
jgi:hypothetical protein